MTGPQASSPALFTIGHSNHELEILLGLLARHWIDAVADVRSTPFSRMNPQFNQPNLKAVLAERAIAYSYLGKELGARSDDPTHYFEGRVDFDRLAASERFQSGLDRLLTGARSYQVAILCAEKEPLDCHRTILVTRQLLRRGARIQHILADGSLEEHAETEQRLLKLTKTEPLPLLAIPGDRDSSLEEAYRIRGREISYRLPDPGADGPQPPATH